MHIHTYVYCDALSKFHRSTPLTNDRRPIFFFFFTHCQWNTIFPNVSRQEVAIDVKRRSTKPLMISEIYASLRGARYLSRRLRYQGWKQIRGNKCHVRFPIFNLEHRCAMLFNPRTSDSLILARVTVSDLIHILLFLRTYVGENF